MTSYKLMKLYGRQVKLTTADGWESAPFYAFIQPLRYKNKMYLGGVNTPIGFNSEGYYLYIGPPEHDVTALIEDDPLVECDSQKYIVDRAEKVYKKNGEVFYIWAIIRTSVDPDEEGESEE